MLASESLWRLYGFDFVQRGPPLVQLDGPTEIHHSWNLGEEPEVQASAGTRAGKKVTNWFEANKNHASASHLPRVYFTQYLVWNKDKKERTFRESMRIRQEDSGITSRSTQQIYYFTRAAAHIVIKLNTVSQRERARFYLWTLLLHVKYATTLMERRRINGVRYISFREACKSALPLCRGRVMGASPSRCVWV